MLSYIRDNLKMKTRKKRIKNQKKSLKHTKELVWNKKTQGNKNILSSQKKYLTKNKSRVPMSSPSPSLNLMGKPMFGGRPIRKTKASDHIADDIAFLVGATISSADKLKEDVKKTEVSVKMRYTKGEKRYTKIRPLLDYPALFLPYLFAYLIKSVLDFNFQILQGAIIFIFGPK